MGITTDRLTPLFATVSIDDAAANLGDALAAVVGVVAINEHVVWESPYPPGTTHEEVLEDVIDTLGAALRAQKGLA